MISASRMKGKKEKRRKKFQYLTTYLEVAKATFQCTLDARFLLGLSDCGLARVLIRLHAATCNIGRRFQLVPDNYRVPKPQKPSEVYF